MQTRSVPRLMKKRGSFQYKNLHNLISYTNITGVFTSDLFWPSDIVIVCICLGGGWGCEISCGGHHRLRGKTTLDGAVFDIAQILAYLVHNMSRSQLYLGLAILADSLLFFSANSILVGLWLNCISSVEITLFLLADILLQHRALF